MSDATPPPDDIAGLRADPNYAAKVAMLEDQIHSTSPIEWDREAVLTMLRSGDETTFDDDLQTNVFVPMDDFAWREIGRGAADLIDAAAAENATLSARIEALEGENAKLRGVAFNVVACFDAATAEGLFERLAEADDDVGSLRDLVERRLLPALEPIAAALPSKDARGKE